MTQITLFDGQSGDGTSNTFYKQSADDLNVYVEGGLGGGTLSLQAKTNNNTWVSKDISSLGFQVVSSSVFTGRIELSGSTSPNLSVYVEAESTEIRGG